jgi:site-specific DNA-methyltransferase (adenine-specific)
MGFAPFYERDGITLYLGDCRVVLPSLAPRSCDLIVTDPPYGVGFVSGLRDGAGFGVIVGDDDASFVPSALSLACKALRVNRHAYIFGPDELLPDELAARTELIWDKSQVGPGNLASPWGPAHERIVFSMYVPSIKNRSDGYGKGAARLRAGSVLRYPRPNARGASRHPSEKPVPLLRRLIESSSHLGECVLDPFVGSGSTLVAAILEGRGGVGIEVEERYVALAAERCDKALDAYQAILAAVA